MSGVKHEWVGGSFVQVHHGLLRALGGDYETAAVIWAIKWSAGTGWWQASFTELMAATCMTRHKLVRALKRAREEGYVESRSQGHGPNAPLEWRICWAPEDAGTVQASRDTESVSRAPQTVPPGSTESAPPLLLEKKTSNPEGEFVQFWQAYPRKVGKGQARTAFKAARKKVALPVLLAALAEQAPRWSEPQFIPHPATWLNGERWEDAAPAGRNGSAGLSDDDERMVREWLRINPVRISVELERLEARDPEAARVERRRLAEENHARAVRAVVEEGWG